MKAEQKCQKCGSLSDGMGFFYCGSHKMMGEFVQSGICEIREENTTLRQRVQELEADRRRDDGACYYCGFNTSSYAGDPNQWPLYFCHEDEPGVAKPHHTGCVTDRLQRVQQVEDEKDAGWHKFYDAKEALEPFAALAPYWKDYADNACIYHAEYDGKKVKLYVGDIRKAADVLAHTLAPTIEKKEGE